VRTARGAAPGGTSGATPLPGSTAGGPVLRRGHGPRHDANTATGPRPCRRARGLRRAWRGAPGGGRRGRPTRGGVPRRWVAPRGVGRRCGSGAPALGWGASGPPGARPGGAGAWVARAGTSSLAARAGDRSAVPPTWGSQGERAEPSRMAGARGLKAGTCLAARCHSGQGAAGRAASQGRPWAGGPHPLALPLSAGWCLRSAPPGAAGAASLDAATRPRRAERRAASDVGDAWGVLPLAPRAASRPAQRIGPILPPAPPHVVAAKEVTLRPTVSLSLPWQYGQCSTWMRIASLARVDGFL